MDFKQRTRSGAAWFMTAVCVLIATVIMISAGGNKAHSSHGRPSLSVVQPTPSGAEQPTAPASGSSTSSNNATTTSPASEIGLNTTLRQELEQFVEAYFYVKPTDDTAKRAKRLPGFVHTPLNLSIQALGLDPGSERLRTNKQHPLTIRGAVDTTQAHVDTDNPKQMDISAQVDLTMDNADGSVFTYNGRRAEGDQPINSSWLQTSGGGWVLVSFSLGGNE